MASVLVLNPHLAFEKLRQTLERQGWRLADSNQHPLLPHEPEFAVFAGAGHANLQYTFNPVCRLRVLEVPDGADRTGPIDLPVVDRNEIARWLTAADEHTMLRGVLAARHFHDAALIGLVDPLRNHSRGAIAQAAARAGEELRGMSRGAVEPQDPALGADVAARARALAALAMVREQVSPLLMALGQDADGALAVSLRPRPEDYARAFLPQYAQAAEQAYERVWAEHPHIARAAPDARLKCYLAPAGMLAEDNELSRHFPGGYRAIAPLLDSHRVWVAWKLLPPGRNAGMAYDGLVWLDDHWAWFPKPYRVLAHVVRGS